MELLIWGLNYQTAPLSLREKLAAMTETLEFMLGHWLDRNIVSEGLLLSTCNRTELYLVSSEDFEDMKGIEDVGHVGGVGSVGGFGGGLLSFANYLNISENDLKPFIYNYTGSNAVEHAMRVASGLNSMVLGEVEILGQMKQAFNRAKELKTIGKYLNRLFQTVFHAAKVIRSNTEIGVNPLSVASVAVKLAGRIFSHLDKTSLLLVGAGDLMRQSALYFREAGVKNMWLSNRTHSRGESLSKTVEAHYIPLQEIPNRLQEVDIVVTGTHSILPLIGKGMVEKALKQRKYRPLLMIDLGVPRNIEPEVKSFEEVYLYCIDDLKEIVDENLKFRQNEALAAFSIIAKESEAFIKWMQAQDSLATLKAFRYKFEQERDRCIQQALLELQMGKSAEEVLKRLSKVLFNRLMHVPTARLRRAGFKGEQEILQFTKELFELST